LMTVSAHPQRRSRNSCDVGWNVDSISAASRDQPQRNERLAHPAALSAATLILAVDSSQPMMCACIAAMACAMPPKALVGVCNFGLCGHCPQGGRRFSSDGHCNGTNQSSGPVFCNHEVNPGRVPRLRIKTTAALDAKRAPCGFRFPSDAGGAPPDAGPVFSIACSRFESCRSRRYHQRHRRPWGPHQQ